MMMKRRLKRKKIKQVKIMRHQSKITVLNTNLSELMFTPDQLTQVTTGPISTQ